MCLIFDVLGVSGFEMVGWKMLCVGGVGRVVLKGWVVSGDVFLRLWLFLGLEKWWGLGWGVRDG